MQCSDKFNVSCGQTDADACAVGIILGCRILSELLPVPLCQTCKNYFRTPIDQFKHIAHKEAKSPLYTFCFAFSSYRFPISTLRQAIILRFFVVFLITSRKMSECDNKLGHDCSLPRLPKWLLTNISTFDATFFSVVQHLLVGQDVFNVEASHSHSDNPRSLGLL